VNNYPDKLLIKFFNKFRTNVKLLERQRDQEHDKVLQSTPRYRPKAHNQQGFTLIMAIFILVVLGLLGGYMARLSGVQNATLTYAVQNARAYQAAKAGLDWALAKISSGGTCLDVSSQSALTFPDMPGFTVSLTCTLTPFQEGNNSQGIYQINALSEFGAYNGIDYVSRGTEASTVK